MEGERYGERRRRETKRRPKTRCEEKEERKGDMGNIERNCGGIERKKLREGWMQGREGRMERERETHKQSYTERSIFL
jgi:hypothetical protein